MNRGKALCEELKKAGIHHVIWVPCSATHFLHQEMLDDPEIKTVQVCRESEAVGICAGLNLGGKRGALIAENCGIYDSGNVLQWAVGLDIPMLLMVGWPAYRPVHYITHPSLVPSPTPRPPAKDYTESFLTHFGIKHYLLDTDEDLKNVAIASEEAWRTHKPVALLVTRADGYMAGS